MGLQRSYARISVRTGRIALHDEGDLDRRPLDREVLIDVRASGLCHSDLHIVESGYGFSFPGVFGHEIAGVVTAVGPEVSTIAVGDHVVGCLIQFCGACTTCLSGRTYECPNPQATAAPA